MKTDFIGDTAPVVLVKLEGDEKIYLDNDLMLYKDPAVKVNRKITTSLTNRIITHAEGIQSERYFAVFEGEGHVAISHDKPGECRAITLDQNSVVYVRWQSLLFAQDSVGYQPNMRNYSKFMTNFILPLEEFRGPGTIYVQAFGNAFQFNLNPGEVLDVPVNNLLLFDATVGISDILFLFPYQIFAQGNAAARQNEVCVLKPNSPESMSVCARVYGPGRVLVHSGR